MMLMAMSFTVIFHDKADRQNISMIDLAARYGIRTQFMYNTQTFDAVFKQIGLLVSKL